MATINGGAPSLDANIGHSFRRLEKVVLIGARAKFPDCFLRLLEIEFEDLEPVRVSTLCGLSRDELAAARLVIVDESFADRLGELSRSVARRSIVLAYRDESLVRRLMEGGQGPAPWSSLLPMATEVVVWLSIVRLLVNGVVYVPPTLLMASDTSEGAVDGAYRTSDDQAARKRLTDREVEVLTLVAAGCMNKQIATRLALSEHTVKQHLQHAMAKLGARNRTEAAMRYAAIGDT